MKIVDHAFPTGQLNVQGANERTVEFFSQTTASSYAEIGVYRGDTALEIANHLAGRGRLHLFDYDDRLHEVERRLRAAGHDNVTLHPNSRRLLDSYNWSLMQLLEEHRGPIFDYVFLDGAHTWAHDALAFLLVDRLLRPGGYIDFDDYGWTLRRSPSMNPVAFPEVERLYTDDQIDTAQVALVVDLLVRLDPAYEEVVPNKIFRKQPA
jgi:predicted O-methyltransferase YrrM